MLGDKLFEYDPKEFKVGCDGWELYKTFKTTGSSRPTSIAKISEEITYCFKRRTN